MTYQKRKTLIWVTILFFSSICNSSSAQYTGSLSGGFASRDSRIAVIGIEEASTDSSAHFKIWPNPCSDYFSIYCDSYLELSGIAPDGKLILDKIQLMPQEVLTFNSSILNKGITILNFRDIKNKYNHFFTLIKN